jgi:hypothetical protein
MSITAIAEVTRALMELLKANLDNTVNVTLLQPGDTALGNNSVNLYLYRVVENAQLKNTDWRGDRTHSPANVPALALDLFYLLTPVAAPPEPGTTTLPQAHTLLGQAMQVFHEHPVINDVHTSTFDFDALRNVDDLRNAFDKIIVRLHPASPDELSKVWTMFNQPYRLSVVYEVSLVQIAPTTPPRSRPAPVMVTALDVFPTDPPRLTTLDPARGGTGGTLSAHGYGLSRKSFATRARFGGQAVEPATVSERQVQFTVPAELEAGPEQEVRILLDGQVSNPATYLVSPWLRRLQPLRGAPGTAPAPPLQVSLEVVGEDLLPPAVISVTLRGSVVPHTVVDGTHLLVTVPPTEPNGFHPLRVTVGGRSSNSRGFEVVPWLRQLDMATPIIGNPLQIHGERLNGTQIRADFGSATVMLKPNADPLQLQVPRVPSLEVGDYEVRVTVDGYESNPLPFTVP